MTKISPIIFIACPTAWRTNGSPARAIRRRRTPASSFSETSARPITSPHVPTLTSPDADLPACAFQSASPSLSAISASAVSGSGTRRKASASDSNATPSDVFSRYSCRNWLTHPLDCAARRSASKLDAWATIRSRSSPLTAARSSSDFSTSGSGARCSFAKSDVAAYMAFDSTVDADVKRRMRDSSYCNIIAQGMHYGCRHV